MLTLQMRNQSPERVRNLAKVPHLQVGQRLKSSLAICTGVTKHSSLDSVKSPQFPSFNMLWECSGYHLSSVVRAIILTLTIFQGNNIVGLWGGRGGRAAGECYLYLVKWVLFVTIFFILSEHKENKGN